MILKPLLLMAAAFMIAVDANVLSRYLLNDDAAQADTAASLIEGSGTVLIISVTTAFLPIL